MVSDELGIQLHDRETTGEPLTAQEKAQIEAWYAQKDAAENAMLQRTQVQLPNLVVLQDRVDATIEQLTLGVQRLHQITQENKLWDLDSSLRLIVLVEKSQKIDKHLPHFY
jgi:hypothetical protein